MHLVKRIISGVVMALILDIHAQGEHGWEIVDTLLIEISAPSRRNAPIVIDGLRDAVERYFQGAVRTSEDDELIVGFDYEIRSHASWFQFVSTHLLPLRVIYQS